MNRRILFILDAPPSATGAAAWRRYLMLARYFCGNRFDVTALFASDDTIGAKAMQWLIATAAQVATCPRDEIENAARHLDRSGHFDIACAMSPDLAFGLKGALRALRLIDLQAPIAEQSRDALSEHLSLARIVLTAEPAQSRFVQDLGLTAAETPTLIDGARKIRPRLRKSQLLAGIWVERDDISISATRAFFDEVVSRGGGGAPNFAIAGPGAREITPPPLPFPVTHLEDGVAETVFYRGLDLAVVPDTVGEAPRLDVVSALECGAAPLASSSALNGLRRRWRLPHFRTLGDMADFLFNRGGELRDGGLLTELRARADWTWSGLVTASARQRERLNREIRANLPS
ncbi:MAG: hypothetical protein KTR21_10490 [Rhodobacteraceae bacterium]|nr:hypothetical protein [Paracoccaceae bacterium]